MPLTMRLVNLRSIFLDLDIKGEEGKLVTSTFFKTTDRMPKGQCLCIRRNCTNIEDLNEHCPLLIERFVEKGYDITSLNTTRGN